MFCHTMKYLTIRLGRGDNRVVSERPVPPEQVKRFYRGNAAKQARVPGVPTFNGDEPVNPVSDPAVAVILLEEGDEPFGRFRPGYNVLDNVDPSKADRLLLGPSV